jgi:histidine ammonia-lyase
MAAAQALDFRDFTPGHGVQAARDVIRKYIPHLDEDRPLNKDHNIMQKLVQSGDILEKVESEIGPLD